MCEYVYNAIQLELKRPQRDNLCYRPTVFIRHRFLIALSLPPENVDNLLSLVKLRESKIA